MAKEIDRWKPVRKGATYCAPACGCGCTWAEFQKATKSARALCRQLGAGWEPDVWENGGWHYMVAKGAPLQSHNRGLIEIHIYGQTEYSAWLQTSPQIITDYFTSPELALAQLNRMAKTRVRELKHTASLIEETLKS